MRLRARCSSPLSSSLATLAGARGGADAVRVFTAEDMLAIRTFAGGQPVAVSSTGRWIAYVLTDRDDEWNVQEPRPTGYVHVQALGSGRPGAPRALTSGAAHSAFPVWSPDGRRLAFIREEQGRGRAVVWDAERDQMTPVGDTFTARIYLAPQWDPSGKVLIVAAALPGAAGAAVPRAIGEEHRRAHPRRSVLHRRAQGDADGDRRRERRVHGAHAGRRSCCGRSGCRRPDGSCSTWRRCRRRSASSARSRTTRSCCRSIRARARRRRRR